MENTRAANVSFSDLSVAQFVERLASSEATPGGGSASAVAASIGAALISMVAGLSTGRPKYAAYEATLARCLALGTALTAEFLELADRDAAAYATYSAALKLPRETEAQQMDRKAAISAAARVAADAPWECVNACVGLLVAAESLAGRSNVNASSDVLVAALLGEAAARGAAENVRINLPATGDDLYAEEMNQRLDSALHEIAAIAARTREVVLSGQAQDPEAE
ncbi:MAG TPA: cyclodeaminase/cyclohydrolase family protein [Candidatus Limnocylindrales bacterium]